MLHVRPAGRAGRGHVKAIALGQERDFEFGQAILCRSEFLHALILPPAAILFLQLLDQRSEHQGTETHRESFCLRHYGSGAIGLSQSTSPSCVLRLPTSMVAPRNSAPGWRDSSHRM